ncbi:Ig-like domain-containing protein, partial [Niallia taxi]|uniref:Ig-like domain-containing protein n=1 Tax=Niallia taxi TaxID=2499688 RepID=UPI003179971F
GSEVTTTADAEGKWTVKITPSMSSMKLTIKAVDVAGNTSESVTATMESTIQPVIEVPATEMPSSETPEVEIPEIETPATEVPGTEPPQEQVEMPDTEAPQQPVIKTVDAKTGEVTGESEANAKIIVTLPDGSEVTTTADAEGKWTVTITTSSSMVVRIKAVDAAGNTSELVTATMESTIIPVVEAPKIEIPEIETPEVEEPEIETPQEQVEEPVTETPETEIPQEQVEEPDTEAPQQPVIKTVDEKTGEITGESEANAKIIVTLSDGSEVTTTANGEGKWTVKITPSMSSMELRIKAIDAAGNTSESVTTTMESTIIPVIEVPEIGTPATEVPSTETSQEQVELPDTEAPQQPVIKTVNEKTGEISGESEANAKIILTLPDGSEVTTTADGEGKWTVTITPSMSSMVVIIKAVDAAGNASESVSATVEPTITPVIETPEVEVPEIETPNTEVSETEIPSTETPQEQVEIPDTEAPQQPVIKTVDEKTSEISGESEANAKIILTLPDGSEVTTTADGEGKWTVTITPSMSSMVVIIKAVDAAGNASESVSATVEPTLIPIMETPEVEIPVLETPTTEVPGTETPKIEVPSTEVSETEIPVIEIPETEIPSTETPQEQVELPDTEAPQQPVIKTVDEKTGEISGESEANAKIIVTLPDSSEVTTTADGEGKWTVTISPSSSKVVRIKAVDAAGNISESVSAQMESTIIPVIGIPVLEKLNTEVPGTETPDTEVPNIEAPEAEVPSEETPDTEVANIEAPEAEVPSEETPDTEVPNTEAPEAEVPSEETPDTEVPNTEAPEAEVPSEETPDTEVPNTEAPEAEVPSEEAPEAEVPSEEAPEAEVPSEETPEVEVPSTETPKQPVIKTIDEKTGEISGESEANAKIIVTLPDSSEVTTTADRDGKWTVTITPSMSSMVVTIKAVDAAGNTSESVFATVEPTIISVIETPEVEIPVIETPTTEVPGTETPKIEVPSTETPQEQVEVPDTEAPKQPVIITIDEKTGEISGESEANAKIIVTLTDGSEVTTTADVEGKWTVTITPSMSSMVVRIKAVDAAGNTSESVSAQMESTIIPVIETPEVIVTPVTDIPQEQVEIPDTEAPQQPVIKTVNEKTGEISGESEANAKIIVTLPDDSEVTTTANNEGKWSVRITTQAFSREIRVTAINAAGIRSQMVYTTLNGDSSIGEETVTPVTEIIGEIPSETVGNKENLATETPVTEPNTLVNEGFSGIVKPIQQDKASDDKETGIPVPTGDSSSTPGAGGNEAQAPGTSVKPGAPAINQNAGNQSGAGNNSQSKLIAKDINVNSTEISGISEANALITVMFSDGSKKGTVADSLGNWSISINPQKVNSKIKIIATDAAGNNRKYTSITVMPVLGGTPISSNIQDSGTVKNNAKQIISTIDNNGIMWISGTSEANATIKLYAANNMLTWVKADSNGKWSIPINSVDMNKEYSVITTNTSGLIIEIAAVSMQNNEVINSSKIIKKSSTIKNSQESNDNELVTKANMIATNNEIHVTPI